MIRARSPHPWYVATPSEVRFTIARAMQRAEANDTQPDITCGSITLRPHQRDAVSRLRRAISEFNGALLADEVGLGKTYTALALAREYDRVEILAPATLLAMWRSAIERTGTANVTLHSIHRFSRGRIPHALPPQGSATSVAEADATLTRPLVIIDEAHHLRTRNTRRFTNVVAYSAGHDALLLTATPLHNRRRELRTLLSLFLGNRADAIDDSTLARCIIRRTNAHQSTAGIPIVREHPPHTLANNHAVLEHILTLPPPLPLSDGTAASALVRLGLLRAWCSSDAAFSDAIRRRQLRGEALVQSLQGGRLPNHQELQSWIVSHDSIQLGFPELLVETAIGEADGMIHTLRAHLNGLQQLLDVHLRTSVADARRAELLRDLARDPNASVIAFSQFAGTVRALHRALSDLAGVASLTSNGGHIASGRITRDEVIGNFAPTANGRPPPPLHRRIRLLITTDLLAEGVNLQDANTVVHLDLPWTHALRQQRVGRIARMGSPHSLVDVHAIAPPMEADRALGLMNALQRKAGLHARFVGRARSEYADAPLQVESGADAATQLHEALLRWRDQKSGSLDDAAAPRDYVPSQSPGFPVAAMRAHLDGWLACVEVDASPNLVTGTFSADRRLAATDDSVSAVLRVVLASEADATPSTTMHHPSSNDVDYAITAIGHWIANRELSALAGRSRRESSRLQQRLRDQLAASIAALPTMARAKYSERVRFIERAISGIRGAGEEQTFDSWNHDAHALPPAAWISQFPIGAPHLPPPENSAVPEGITPHSRIRALLILRTPDAE
jgi:superfamily II DNA or RNA helicase